MATNFEMTLENHYNLLQHLAKFPQTFFSWLMRKLISIRITKIFLKMVFQFFGMWNNITFLPLIMHIDIRAEN